MKRKAAAYALLCVCIFLLAGCGKSGSQAQTPAVEKGQLVVLHYAGTLKDGSEFDSTKGREPLSFVFGEGQMIPGFEAGVTGMRAGEKKSFLVKAEDAYGAYNEDMVQALPLTDFPQDIVPEAGMEFLVNTSYGPVPVRIKEVREGQAFIDFNPPLAGQDLTFEVEILEVRAPTEADRESMKGEAFPFPVEEE